MIVNALVILASKIYANHVAIIHKVHIVTIITVMIIQIVLLIIVFKTPVHPLFLNRVLIYGG
jgi:hypothetical protein